MSKQNEQVKKVEAVQAAVPPQGAVSHAVSFGEAAIDWSKEAPGVLMKVTKPPRLIELPNGYGYISQDAIFRLQIIQVDDVTHPARLAVFFGTPGAGERRIDILCGSMEEAVEASRAVAERVNA